MHHNLFVTQWFDLHVCESVRLICLVLVFEYAVACSVLAPAEYPASVFVYLVLEFFVHNLPSN